MDTEEHHHDESPERAEGRLRRAGFEIVDRQDRFIEGGQGGWWLIVGRRH